MNLWKDFCKVKDFINSSSLLVIHLLDQNELKRKDLDLSIYV